MTNRRLPLFPIVAALALTAPPTLAGQSEEPPKSFTPKYIDAARYRDDATLLYDWPELTRLIVWTRRLEAAVASSDASLSDTLLVEFAARVDTLRSAPMPSFLGGGRDSVAAALDVVAATIEQAEASLAALPEATVTPLDSVTSADTGHERTIVTGQTAVTVPRGVAVGGERDSLPMVAFEAGGPLNFVDLVALALSELDRVVHITRKAGSQVGRGAATPPRGDPGARPAPGTPPRPESP
jgi:hypothetical protein